MKTTGHRSPIQQQVQCRPLAEMVDDQAVEPRAEHQEEDPERDEHRPRDGETRRHGPPLLPRAGLFQPVCHVHRLDEHHDRAGGAPQGQHDADREQGRTGATDFVEDVLLDDLVQLGCRC